LRFGAGFFQKTFPPFCRYSPDVLSLPGGRNLPLSGGRKLQAIKEKTNGGKGRAMGNKALKISVTFVPVFVKIIRARSRIGYGE
jgi:hypothetical protein